jgi:hypothetical protein
MPPRYSYWTILAGGLPTAFRAAEREELEPTFKRLRDKHPDAEMKWFARGKLWSSPEEARQPAPDDRRGSSAGRGRDWRPGGEHRDPRQPYKDAKKARNLDRRKEKFARKHGDALAPRDGERGPRRPPADRPTGPAAARGTTPRDRFPRDSADRGAAPGRRDLPSGPRSDVRDRPSRDARPEWRGKPSGPGKPDWRDKPAAHGKPDWRDKPAAHGKPEWRDKPAAHGMPDWRNKPAGPRKPEWRDKPAGHGKPEWRDKPASRPWAGADRPEARPRPQTRGKWTPSSRPQQDRPRSGPPTGPAARDRSAGFSADRRDSPKPPRAARDDSRPAPPFRDARTTKPPAAGDRRGAPEWRDRPRAPKGGAPRADWRARPPQATPHGDRFDAHVPRDRRPDSRGPRRDADRPGPGGARAAWPRDSQRRPESGPAKPHGDPLRPGGRRFDRKEHPRNQGVGEPPPPPRPRGPNREPRPSEKPEPSPPPRPAEPAIPPPGPPERGRARNPRRER